MCLSVVKRSPCLFSLLWNDMFPSLPNSSRVGSRSHTRPICVPSSLSMLGWLEDSQNRIANEADPPDCSMISPICFPPTFSNLPSWSDETVGRCWPALARLWVLVWLVAGRWALVVKIGKENRQRTMRAVKRSFAMMCYSQRRLRPAVTGPDPYFWFCPSLTFPYAGL